MKYVVCTTKGSGKRIMVNTREMPDYKDRYNDEYGNPFCAVEEPKKVTKKVVVAQEVEYECGDCDKSYKLESSLKGHITKNHG